MAIKKYTNGSWVSASYRKYGTETDAITTLPATVIGDGTPISSYVIKGNMEQTGTPTPSSPIYPSECGDLVASGEHAGQYKLPITLGGTTTDIYLGEVQSTRRIKKLVLTGEEDWDITGNDPGYTPYFRITYFTSAKLSKVVCTHYISPDENISVSNNVTGVKIQPSTLYSTVLIVRPPEFAVWSVADFKSYLAAQYAAGTPVTVWYVLDESETGIVNEPIRKIGDYADSVSGAGLATSGAGQAFDVGTALKPSEVDMTYHGWHEHEDTKYST